MNNKVLIIEDNLSDQLLISAFVKQLGFECHIAPNSDAAVKLLIEYKFNLIILDMNLPEISGMQFLIASRFSPFFQDTPIVVLSGKDDTSTIDSTKNFGVNYYIKKPINFEKHKEILEKFVVGNS